MAAYIHAGVNLQEGLNSEVSPPSRRRLFVSILVVELMQVPIVIVFSIVIPSLFKFVTSSPEARPFGETSEEEVDYSGQVRAMKAKVYDDISGVYACNIVY